MNEIDQRKWNHALQVFEKAKECEQEKPELAASWYQSGHLLMTAVKLAHGKETEAKEILCQFLKVITPFYTSKKVLITPLKQNELLFIAGYTEQFDMAKKLIEIPVDASGEHGFIQLVNYYFRQWIGNAPQNSNYQPIKTEQSFFEQLKSLSNGNTFNPNGIDSFWSATKNKRYQNTIWGMANIFSVSLENYANAFNK
jgi:hypothetical protein